MLPIILFLDFDGVLHPLFDYSADRTRARAYTGPLFLHADRFADLIVPHINEVEIVISSTWGQTRSLEELRLLLPQHVRHRVTATIWSGETASGLASEPRTRYQSIVAWLGVNRPAHGERWLAIDDDHRGWPAEELTHLVHCDDTLGCRRIQDELATRLRKYCAVPNAEPERTDVASQFGRNE